MEWRSKRTELKERQVKTLLRQVNKLTKPHRLELSLENRESFTVFTEGLIRLVFARKIDSSELNEVNRLVSRILALMGY